jgi:hypothetical protein
MCYDCDLCDNEKDVKMNEVVSHLLSVHEDEIRDNFSTPDDPFDSFSCTECDGFIQDDLTCSDEDHDNINWWVPWCVSTAGGYVTADQECN